jgi:fumarate reductase flavoprotein subunit
VQFHPTGLLAGPETRITGTIIEEGLRGFGGYLLDGAEERFMHKYDDRNERATRDIVSRAMLTEMREGKTAPNGGLYITMKHLDEKQVRKNFKGMVERCADYGFDLAAGIVEVVPTAHYMMGGVEMGENCETEINGMFVAGEDSGGVHGANRLGGNGVANSTVFGGVAGDEIAPWIGKQGQFYDPDEASIEDTIAACRHPLSQAPGNLEGVRERLYDVMWEDAGIIRDAASLSRAMEGLNELDAELDTLGVAESNLAYNLTWHDWMNLKNLILVSKSITVTAQARENSRGAHYRADFPEPGELETSYFTRVREQNGSLTVENQEVSFTRVKPGQTLITKTAAE